MAQATTNARMCAYKILHKIEFEGAFSNIALKDGLYGVSLSGADRRLVTTIVYGCIKYKRYLDYIISQFSSVKIKKLSDSVLLILRMGAYQIMKLERVPDSAAVNESVKLATKLCFKSKALINAVLRKISAAKDTVRLPDGEVSFLGVMYSYPDDIVNMWLDEYGKEFTEKLLGAGNENPPVSVRVNTLKTNADELLSMLEKEGVEAKKANEAMVFISGAGDVSQLESYKNGLYTPQGMGSYYAGKVLSPKKGQIVMDLCAAPGGKSTHMGELMENEGQIISCDIHPHKTALIEAGAKRLGIDIIKTVARDSSKADKAYFDKADKVLCDVVCSGLGIIHKKPDIKWSFDAEKTDELAALQYAILEAGSKYVKKGGELVYSTCTICLKENMGVVKKFLDLHEDYELCGFEDLIDKDRVKDSAKEGYIQFYPTDDAMDGFFICKIRRKG